MAYVMIRHKVRDYEAWKAVFDEHGVARKEAGSGGGYLLRNLDDPNELVIFLRWDDLEKARAFVGSQDLKEAMARAGVADHPGIYFLELVEEPEV